MLNQLGASVDSFLPRGQTNEGGILQPGSLHTEILDSALSKVKMLPGEVLQLVELAAASCGGCDPHMHVCGSGGGCQDAQNTEEVPAVPEPGCSRREDAVL